MDIKICVYLSPNTIYILCQPKTGQIMTSPMAYGRPPVFCLEHNFVISGLIDLKLGICICCNNMACSAKEL